MMGDEMCPPGSPDSYRLSEVALRRLLEVCKSRGVEAILEFGSGASTAIMAEHVRKVVSLENVPRFLYRDERVHYVFSGLARGFYGEEAIAYAFAQLAGCERARTAVVVDGPAKAMGGRRERVLEYVALLQGRVVLVDDTHRSGERQIVEGLMAAELWQDRFEIVDEGVRQTALLLPNEASSGGQRGRTK